MNGIFSGKETIMSKQKIVLVLTDFNTQNMGTNVTNLTNVIIMNAGIYYPLLIIH